MGNAGGATSFSGFEPSLMAFLRELQANNRREWFQANKARYETLVLEPALAFIDAMSEPLRRISPHFDAIPKRTGGSLMRVYRDTRFSRDKTPYKTNVGIQFRHRLGRDVHAPGFYLHLAPEEIFLAAGMWHPPSDALRQVRERIAEHSQEWKKSCSARPFRARFELGGESLKRAPRGFDPDHPMIDDLKRKDFVGVRALRPGQETAPDFAAAVASDFRASAPLMGFLCEAIGAPF